VSFHLQIKNYRVLQSVDFTPDGVCLIVGPNGCGKTTLLSVIELLRYAFKEGFGNALYHYGGPWGFDLSPDTQTNLMIEKAGFRWELKPTVTSNGVIYPIEETMTKDNSTLFAVEQGASQFGFKRLSQRTVAFDGGMLRTRR
jgi:predicted ATPase